MGPRRYLVKISVGREFVRNRLCLFSTKEQHQPHNWTSQIENKAIEEHAGTPAQMVNPTVFQAEVPTVLRAETPLQKSALVRDEGSPVTSRCGRYVKP